MMMRMITIKMTLVMVILFTIILTMSMMLIIFMMTIILIIIIHRFVIVFLVFPGDFPSQFDVPAEFLFENVMNLKRMSF